MEHWLLAAAPVGAAASQAAPPERVARFTAEHKGDQRLVPASETAK